MPGTFAGYFFHRSGKWRSKACALYEQSCSNQVPSSASGSCAWLPSAPAALAARAPAPAAASSAGVCVSVSWAASRRVVPRAGSALVNAAVKAAACFQLLNGDDIFRCHPNPRLIPLLLTSFQSLVWSPAAFRIFPLGYFCRPLTAVRLHPTAAILQLRRLPRSLSDARLIVPKRQSLFQSCQQFLVGCHVGAPV